jgi:hypothetical protein
MTHDTISDVRHDVVNEGPTTRLRGLSAVSDACPRTDTEPFPEYVEPWVEMAQWQLTNRRTVFLPAKPSPPEPFRQNRSTAKMSQADEQSTGSSTRAPPLLNIVDRCRFPIDDKIKEQYLEEVNRQYKLMSVEEAAARIMGPIKNRDQYYHHPKKQAAYDADQAQWVDEIRKYREKIEKDSEVRAAKHARLHKALRKMQQEDLRYERTRRAAEKKATLAKEKLAYEAAVIAKNRAAEEKKLAAKEAKKAAAALKKKEARESREATERAMALTRKVGDANMVAPEKQLADISAAAEMATTVSKQQSADETMTATQATHAVIEGRVEDADKAAKAAEAAATAWKEQLADKAEAPTETNAISTEKRVQLAKIAEQIPADAEVADDATETAETQNDSKAAEDATDPTKDNLAQQAQYDELSKGTGLGHVFPWMQQADDGSVEQAQQSHITSEAVTEVPPCDDEQFDQGTGLSHVFPWLAPADSDNAEVTKTTVSLAEDPVELAPDLDARSMSFSGATILRILKRNSGCETETPSTPTSRQSSGEQQAPSSTTSVESTTADDEPEEDKVHTALSWEVAPVKPVDSGAEDQPRLATENVAWTHATWPTDFACTSGDEETPKTVVEQGPSAAPLDIQHIIDTHPGIASLGEDSQPVHTEHGAVPPSDVPKEAKPLASFEHIHLTCAYCQAPTCNQDLGVVLCNACGPLSTIRYCSKDHLVVDAPRHAQVCKKSPLASRMDMSTLGWYLSQQVPQIYDICGWNTPERTRQLMHSIHHHETSDYALYSDLRNSVNAGHSVRSGIFPTNHITFKPEDPRKDIFNRLLNALFMNHGEVAAAMVLFRMMRQKLFEDGVLSIAIQKELVHQLKMEFGAQNDAWTLAPREDVDFAAEWYGAYGLQQQVEKLENFFPLLRAWRREHPEFGLSRSQRFWGMGYYSTSVQMGGDAGSRFGRGWGSFGKAAAATANAAHHGWFVASS